MLFKMFRVFIDPMFESKTPKSSTSTTGGNSSSQAKPQENSLGEYVDYEEIK